MSRSDWPASEGLRRELPSVDELPPVESGYEQAAVEEAFDAFYRHVSQLDATLRTLEAVDAFRRDADALRVDLRAYRAPTFEPAPRASIPGVVFRLAAESGLLIAVAVVSALGHFRPLLIVALMAAAFVAVTVSEALAGRSAFVPPVFGFAEARPRTAGEPDGEQELPPEVPLESDPWERRLVAEAGAAPQ